MTCKRVKTTHVCEKKFLVLKVDRSSMVAYHRDNNKNISRALNMADGNGQTLGYEGRS